MKPMPAPVCQRLKEGAFTLLEVFISIAVLAAVIGLIFAAMPKVREQAHATKCVSNLRQVASALFADSTDHQGRIVPHIELDPDTGKGMPGTFWHQVLREKGYLLSSRDLTVGVHFCPSLPSGGGNEESYGMRRWRRPGDLWDTTKYLTTIKERADFFLMVDSYKTSSKRQGYFVGPGSTVYRVRLAHGGRANALFADGHVAAKERPYFEDLQTRQREYQNNTSFSFWPEEP